VFLWRLVKLSENELMQLPREQLVAIILRQQEMIERLEKRVAALEEEVRESKRAKAPFGKGVRKKSALRPGRRRGEGIFVRRSEPEAASGDVIEEIGVKLAAGEAVCPRCGAALIKSREVATITDTPEPVPQVIKRFHVETGHCPQCGMRRRGRHPELSPGQSGANGHQLGPRVKALAYGLHYHDGLPLRRVPAVIARMTGIRCTQSALTQSAGKLCTGGGGLLDGHYQALREAISRSPVVNTDDTGWRVNATLAFMMGFFTGETAYYQIRMRHRHQEVLEVLGENYQGMAGTDRGPAYDAHELSGIAMQKCLSHLLQNLSKVEAVKTGRAKTFSRQLKAILREGLKLWQDYRQREMTLRVYRRRGREIARRLDVHLRDRTLSDADNQRLLDGIGYQHDRDRLTLFLRRPEIEPTNNRAERGLRPAVIARKVSHCSKNQRGAKTYAVMKTLFATLALRTNDVIGAFAELLRGKSMAAACER
jgi:transposase